MDMFPPSKPSDVKQDSKEQYKTTGYQFSAKIEFLLSFWFKRMHTGVLKYLLKIPSNWTDILRKTK